ncbi:MAG: hypothetical protein AB1Z23_01015 [Eubacteriales bacterium]
MRKKMFWMAIALLAVEVVALIFMMKLAQPLKEKLPLYTIIVLVLAALSLFFVFSAKKNGSDTKVLLFGLTAGMIWWTIAEINGDVFKGSGIEDLKGFWLLFLVILALSTIWKDINKTSKIAISAFLANWGSHMVIKILLYLRDPSTSMTIWTGSLWNIFNIIGFAYGVFSVAAIIYIAMMAIRKGVKETSLHYYVLAMYVAIMNLQYIFAKSFFVLW